MDIRDIRERVPVIEAGLELEFMYEVNERQIEGYKPLEKLPDYPIDVNIPKNQVLLKSLISQVIEELMEGYESLNHVAEIWQNHGWNSTLLSEEEERQVSNHLQNANEEQADALGFFLSLLVYSNILPEDIYAYKSRDSSKIINLDQVMVAGSKMMELPEDPQRDLYRIFEEDDSVIKGFKRLSQIQHEGVNKYAIFEITYTLNLARNLLKNRSWKITPVMTRELDFQELVVKAFYYFMGFLKNNGFAANSLRKIFWKKAKLNEWRINSNY